jgi:hypothetical protein
MSRLAVLAIALALLAAACNNTSGLERQFIPVLTRG